MAPARRAASTHSTTPSSPRPMRVTPRWWRGSTRSPAASSSSDVGRRAMNVGGKPMRTIWPEGEDAVGIIDQTLLPHELTTVRLETPEAAAQAIRAMLVRGAPLIGAAAAYGVALAMRRDPSDGALDAACALLLATRPTAVNLRWALDDMAALLRPLPPAARAASAWRRAGAIAEEDVALNRAI